jgi:hypothetical protein
LQALALRLSMTALQLLQLTLDMTKTPFVGKGILT